MIVTFGLCLLLFCAGCAANAGNKVPATEATATSQAEGLGIEITGIRQTAAGYMLDFRYQVLDPEKSTPLFNRSNKPYLIHEKSGGTYAVPNMPKVGPLRQTTKKPETDRSYFVFFGNPGRTIQPGDLVTVVIGEYRFEHLIVE